MGKIGTELISILKLSYYVNDDYWKATEGNTKKALLKSSKNWIPKGNGEYKWI